MTAVQSRLQSITFDCADPYRMSLFWARLTGFVEPPDDRNGPGRDEACLRDPSGRHPNLLFLRVPEGKTVKNRVHLDLRPLETNRNETVVWALAHGARMIEDHRTEDGRGWVVLSDPEGNEFCIERSFEEKVALGDERPLTAMGERRMPEVATTGEREMLESLLDWYREGVILKVRDLSDELAVGRPGPSGTTLAGLVKHLALVEDSWFTERFAGFEEPEPWAGVDWDADPDWEFTTARHEPLSVNVQRYRAACDRSRKIAADADLDDLCANAESVGRPFTLRWVYVHMLEETARHLGHMDILRELADGATGE